MKLSYRNPAVLKSAAILVQAAEFPMPYAKWTGDYDTIDQFEWIAKNYIKEGGPEVKPGKVTEEYAKPLKGYPGEAKENMVIKNAIRRFAKLAMRYVDLHKRAQLHKLNIKKEARRCNLALLDLADTVKGMDRIPKVAEAAAVVLDSYGRMFQNYLRENEE